MGETCWWYRHSWSWVERKEKDIAPVEIGCCLNLHLLWTFPASPLFPLTFCIPSLSSVGNCWQQTAARDQIQEVASCSKPGVWQHRTECGWGVGGERSWKGNFEQPEWSCLSHARDTGSGRTRTLWSCPLISGRASVWCWVRCDGHPGAEWTLLSNLLHYMFERMGKWEVAFLD